MRHTTITFNQFKKRIYLLPQNWCWLIFAPCVGYDWKWLQLMGVIPVCDSVLPLWSLECAAEMLRSGALPHSPTGQNSVPPTRARTQQQRSTTSTVQWSSAWVRGNISAAVIRGHRSHCQCWSYLPKAKPLPFPMSFLDFQVENLLKRGQFWPYQTNFIDVINV